MTRPTRPYTVAVPLRWSDMDAYGHVNNVQFLRLMEDARIKAFQEWFGPRNNLLSSGCVVARSEIEYLTPLSFQHDGVAVDVWVSRIGGATFDLGYEIRDPPEVGHRLYAQAETTMVWYDFDGHAPRRGTPAERAVLEAVGGAPVPLRRRGRR